MSSLNLNLLPSKARFQAAKIKLRQTVNKIIYIIVGILVLSFVVVTGLSLFTQIRIDMVTKQLKTSQANYAAMNIDVINSQNIKYKAKVVGGVLKSRFEYGRAFETVQNMFPSGITLNSYNLMDENRFVIDGTAESKASIDLLETTIIDINSGKNDLLVSAKLNSLILKGTIWTFGMEVLLK